MQVCHSWKPRVAGIRSSRSTARHLPCDCNKWPATSDSSARVRGVESHLGVERSRLACCFPGQLPPHPMEISRIPEGGGGDPWLRDLAVPDSPV